MRRMFLAPVALVAALGAALAGCSGAADDVVADRPAAPEGMQMLGADGVVIAVPDSWTQVDPDPCRFALPASTYAITVVPDLPDDERLEALQDAAQACAEAGNDGGARPDVGDANLTITVGPSMTALVSIAGEPAPEPTESTREGLDVDLYVDCQEFFCGATWQLDGVTFGARVDPDAGAAAIAAMDESIRRLPDGWTTAATDGTVVASD